MFDYEYFLTEKLNTIKLANNWDIDLEISNEQAFAKIKTFLPNTIYVVIKRLATNYQYNVLTMPIPKKCLRFFLMKTIGKPKQVEQPM